MKLHFLSKLKIAFCPMWGTPAVRNSCSGSTLIAQLAENNFRELISRTSTKKAIASNPKCAVVVELLETDGLWKEVPSKIEVTYSDGSVQEILPEKGMHIEAIEEMIRRRTDALEFEAEMAEMKANPVTGPMPIGSFRGRKHTYALYAQTEEKTSKRAAGGVKTKK